MAVRLLFNAKYNAHTEPLFKAAEILPFNNLCDFFKIQFMQQFSQGFLPTSFSNTWITNAIRRADQPPKKLNYVIMRTLTFLFLELLCLINSHSLLSQNYGTSFQTMSYKITTLNNYQMYQFVIDYYVLSIILISM